MKAVIVTGADGYCGWPVVLKLLSGGYKVIGVDNEGRRRWVQEVGSKSVIPIAEINDRVKKANEVYENRYTFHHSDLTDYTVVYDILKNYKPDVILHLASQPSAPYSARDIDSCNFTQTNNNQMLRNILWAMNTLGYNDCHLIVTTTTGIYGAPDFDIPEGGLIIKETELPFPSMGGSWYHMSRAHDAANMWLANKFFKFPISELRTSIVSGSSTEETRKCCEFENRFDVDFYFGVVTNRFVAQALSTRNLTVYGKGFQKKPMISLEDMVRSTVNCVEKGTVDKFTIYNQMDQEIAIVDIAKTIKNYCECKFNMPIKIDHISNPRIEDEEHQMVMHNEKFISKLCDNKIVCSLQSTIEQMCSDLYPYRDLLVNLVRK